MHTHLHADARTTPKTRRMIRTGSLSVAEPADMSGVGETTVRRWKRRDRVADGPHTRHDPGQGATETDDAPIGALRRDVGLSLDDIVEAMRRCVNPKLSRGAVHRCPTGLGLAKRPEVDDGPEKGKGLFAKATCGFIHADLKHLPRPCGKPAYVFVAVDRAARFVHVDIVGRRDGRTIAECPQRFPAAFPHKVHAILTDNGLTDNGLTDNGAEFTDRFAVDMKNRPAGKPSGRHPFHQVCRAAAIEHGPTRPFRPETNGMAERFNRRPAEALRGHPAAGTNSGKNRFVGHDERNAFIRQVVDDCNRTRLRCIACTSPLEALNNLAGHDTKAGVTKVGAAR